jgi:hypothetical protein
MENTIEEQLLAGIMMTITTNRREEDGSLPERNNDEETPGHSETHTTNQLEELATIAAEETLHAEGPVQTQQQDEGRPRDSPQNQRENLFLPINRTLVFPDTTPTGRPRPEANW